MAVDQLPLWSPWSIIPWGVWGPVLPRLRGEEAGVSVLQFS